MNRSDLLAAPMGCLGMITWIGAGLLHVWTVILSYQAAGFIGAAVATILPVLSEMFWAVFLWQRVGFWNWYTLACAGIVAIFSVISLIAKLADGGEEQKEAQ